MPKKCIVFENDGLIDVRAIKTFGVNVKETENPFGYFGTGLKYAIAILLRSGCEITIYRGSEETYKFSLNETTIRGEEFSIVQINDEEMGFTTHLGKNWKMWQAYRELYCNCLDENGKVSESVSTKFNKAGKTLVVVSGDEFITAHNTRHQFILESTPLATIDNVEIHKGPGTGFFYKGIFIAGLSNTSLFRYNILENVQLTEDRTLTSLFGAEYEIIRALRKCNDEEIIEATLTAQEGVFEADLHFDYGKERPKEVFMDTMAKLLKDRGRKINLSAVMLYKQFAKVEKPVPVELTPVQTIQLQRAKDFTKRLGLFQDSFPIIVTESLGKGVLGLAEKGTIYLSLETFDMGTKMVAITLIEEYIHLSRGYADMTRAMQNFLFNKIITLGEDKLGEPL